MGQANKHMHHSSVLELIKRFESPERDKYQQPEKVMDYLGNISGERIMDLGAGSGYFSVRMVNNGAYVIAADVDDEFLKYLKDRKKKEGFTDKQMEIRKIPHNDCGLQKKEADKVLIVNTYHHIEDRVKYFNKMLSGLKDGGEVIVIDFFKKPLEVGPPPEHKISKEQVMRELKEAGFKTIVYNIKLLPSQYIIHAK